MLLFSVEACQLLRYGQKDMARESARRSLKASMLGIALGPVIIITLTIVILITYKFNYYNY